MSDITSSTGQIETVQEIGTSPEMEVRRWLLELDLSDKREKDWRKRCGELLDKYRQKDSKKNPFNMLWSNTDTLLPAIYNSQPKPDVRRRFADTDPVGKAVSDVLTRALEFSLDTYDFNAIMVSDVMDMLLPGRGISRVRYVPSLRETSEIRQELPGEREQGEQANDDDAPPNEELAWEQVIAEHVQWDDYREGPGKTWDEIPWIAYRHRMTRNELIDKFGAEKGNAMTMDAASDEEIHKHRDDAVRELFKTAVVWEIWDKDSRKVIFVSQGYRNSVLDKQDDPLKLIGFFPSPRPLRGILDSSSNVPIPLPDYYRQQEEELNLVTVRISRLIRGLKLRGVYDATITELSEVMRGEDNDLIAAQNVVELRDIGGLQNAVWMLPIDQAANVLRELYQQRDQIKQIIYEITGISDIMRGATDAGETATAQQIKATNGSLRVRRLQAEVQRYIRDILRIKAEIISERFQPETLYTMTGLQFPDQMAKQQAQMQFQQAQAQYQQQAAMAQQQGQQPPQAPQPPPILSIPSWQEIIGVMRDDALRTFKVDIETDSTVAASMESDMQGLEQVLGGVVQVMNGFAPAVQQGIMPVDVLKELMLTVVRRARMGNAVEDAIDKIQAPPPKQDQTDPRVQVAQIKAQSDEKQSQADAQQNAQLEMAKIQSEERLSEKQAQLDVWVAQQQQAAQQAQAEAQGRFDAMLKQREMQMEMMLEAQRRSDDERQAAMQAQLQLILQHMKGVQAVEVAEIGKQTTMTPDQANAAEGDFNASL